MRLWTLVVLGLAVHAAYAENPAAEEEMDSSSMMDALVPMLKKAIGPAIQQGKKWGESYRDDPKYENLDVDAKQSAMITFVCTMNAANGGFWGLFGGFAAGPAIFTSILASFGSQAALAAGIATLRGYDLEDEKSDTMVMGIMLGEAAQQAMAPMMAEAGKNLGKNALKSVSGSAIKSINAAMWPLVGRKLLTKAGETGLVNLAKWVPLMGAPIGAAFDGGFCFTAAKTLDFTIFQGLDRPQEQLKQLLQDNGLKDLVRIIMVIPTACLWVSNDVSCFRSRSWSTSRPLILRLSVTLPQGC